MACDTRTLPNETLAQRKASVQDAVAKLEKLLATGSVQAVIGPQGGISFRGWGNSDRNRITDACAYRRLLAGNSAVLRRQLARAEVVAGRKVDPKAVAAGEHSHDDGRTWGRHDH